MSEALDFVKQNAEGKDLSVLPGSIKWVVDSQIVFMNPDSGEIEAIHCEVDFDSKGGMPADGRRIRGTIHWVSQQDSVDGTVKHFDYLLADDESSDGLTSSQNSQSIYEAAKFESCLLESTPGEVFQFERLGYFSQDSVDSKPGSLVFNRIVTLRDTWKKFTGKK